MAAWVDYYGRRSSTRWVECELQAENYASWDAACGGNALIFCMHLYKVYKAHSCRCRLHHLGTNILIVLKHSTLCLWVMQSMNGSVLLRSQMLLMAYNPGQPWQQADIPWHQWQIIFCLSQVCCSLRESIYDILYVTHHTRSYINWCRTCLFPWWFDCIKDASLSFGWEYTSGISARGMVWPPWCHAAWWDLGNLQRKEQAAKE